jgi:hypothetical protein
MNDPQQHSLTLHLGMSLMRRAHLARLLGLAFGLLLTALAVVTYWALANGAWDREGSDLLGLLWKTVTQDPDLKLVLRALALLGPVGIVSIASQRQAYLQITSLGLEGNISKWTGLGLSRQTTGRWLVPWAAIRAVRLVHGRHARQPAQRLRGYRLVLDTDRGETWLAPFSWVNRQGRDHRLGLKEAFVFARFDPEAVLERAPLMGALRARGLVAESRSETWSLASAGFDLTGHRGLVIQLVLFFAAGFYAVFDTFVFAQYRPLEALPSLPFVAVTGAGALAVMMLGRGAPRAERLVLGVLTVAALTAAVHPALLRVNALTATPQEVAYVATGAGRFEARDAGLPALDLSNEDVNEYWAQYPIGAEHPFTLLRGAGMFYQLDLAPLYARTRSFYAAQDEGG